MKKSTGLLASVLLMFSAAAAGCTGDDSKGLEQRATYNDDNTMTVEVVEKGEVITAKTFPLTADPVSSADAVPPLEEALESVASDPAPAADDTDSVSVAADPVVDDAPVVDVHEAEVEQSEDASDVDRNDAYEFVKDQLTKVKNGLDNALQALSDKYSDITSGDKPEETLVADPGN